MLMDECVTPRWLIQVCPRSCVQQEAPRCCLEEGRGCFPALLPSGGALGKAGQGEGPVQQEGACTHRGLGVLAGGRGSLQAGEAI